MTRNEMYAQLVSSELDYAHFNALRTAVDENQTGIRRGIHATIEYLMDPTRPTSAYYNRAVGRFADSLAEPVLRALPPGIVGLEITPEQLTGELAGILIDKIGFRPADQLCYLGMVPNRRAPVTCEVNRLGPEHVAQFFDLLQQSGVEFPPEKRARKKDFYCNERFRTYISRTSDGAVSGWGTMYVNAATAFLGNSFTLPRFRGAGAHGSLLAARLNDAAGMGLECAFTDVEHGSQSYRNCKRAGLRTVSINMIWKRSASR
jgi:hypothetical protein